MQSRFWRTGAWGVLVLRAERGERQPNGVNRKASAEWGQPNGERVLRCVHNLGLGVFGAWDVVSFFRWRAMLNSGHEKQRYA